MKPLSKLARKLCEELEIPYVLGAGYATIDGKPVNEIKNIFERKEGRHMKTLVVVDMQYDFVYGALGTEEARAIALNVKSKIMEYYQNGELVVFTKDTHTEDYLQTQEGKNLPIKHCVRSTDGWGIIDELDPYVDYWVEKESFGYPNWNQEDDILGSKLGSEIEIIGVCTDICVVSNALIIKAQFPELKISVDASCCAGTTPENHKAALQVMRSCQIEIKGENV